MSVRRDFVFLHFTKELLQKVKDMGVDIAEVTLHVGLGTFRPVKVENVLDHHMHSEFYMVSQEAADKINRAKESVPEKTRSYVHKKNCHKAGNEFFFSCL